MQNNSSPVKYWQHLHTAFTRERNLKTNEQLNNLIWTNRKVETKLYLLPIGPNKIV